jgi:hypothetical protein
MRRPYSFMTNPYPVYSGYCGYYPPAYPPQWFSGPSAECFSGPQYNRKKQRRQAAAGVVQSLWGNNSQNDAMGRKSTAQPRPVLNVPPGGIGPIANPNENDVLCGRGGRINSHAGNIRFRDVIQSKKKAYLGKTTKKLEKAHIAASVVNDIRSMQPPGRFLKEDGKSGMWFDIGDAKAIKKTGQALREDAPEIRPEIYGESSGDEKNAFGDEAKESPGKSPKAPKENNNSKPMKANSPKAQQTNTSPASSPKAAISQDFNAHGPQLLPGAWPNASGKDQQARAAMPPPFQNYQQANPYMMPQGQAQVQNSFEPRIIPIQAPKNLYNMPNQFFSGGRSVGSKASNASKHAQEVLAHSGANVYHQRMQALEDNAFGRTFHPPASAIGSERTVSTISGLTDPALSNISSQTGSGMHGTGNNFNAGNFSSGPQQRQTGARGSLRLSQVFPSHDFGSGDLGLSRGQTSDMSASFRTNDMQTSVRMGGDMSSFNGSIMRSSSFPDMSSIVDSDSWNNAIAESDEDMPVLRSILSSSNSRASHHTSGVSMMSIGSGTSSSQWMNASFDGRSILSEMSSDLDALDLAS